MSSILDTIDEKEIEQDLILGSGFSAQEILYGVITEYDYSIINLNSMGLGKL